MTETYTYTDRDELHLQVRPYPEADGAPGAQVYVRGLSVSVDADRAAEVASAILAAAGRTDVTVVAADPTDAGLLAARLRADR